MYSRYHKAYESDIRLPENYGGIAFSERNLLKQDTEPHPRTLEVAKPTPTPPQTPSNYHNTIEKDPPPDTPTPASVPKPPANAPTAHPVGLLPIGASEGFPFAHGIGVEELFIIALIILLSKNEQASDMVLWLTLLLFCG